MYRYILPTPVNIRFHVLFHSPPGVLFNFPSQYLFSIGHWVVFWLGGWFPRLHANLALSALLWYMPSQFPLRLRDSHSLRCDFPVNFSYFHHDFGIPFTPWYLYLGLASSAFARHYSQNRFAYFSYRYLDVSVHDVPLLETTSSSQHD